MRTYKHINIVYIRGLTNIQTLYIYGKTLQTHYTLYAYENTTTKTQKLYVHGKILQSHNTLYIHTRTYKHIMIVNIQGHYIDINIVHTWEDTTNT